MGAAHELYRLTGDDRFLNDAIQAAHFAISDPGMIDTAWGILRDEGGGDGGLFKGIFVRYFTILLGEKDLPIEVKSTFEDFLLHNAIIHWTQGVDKDDMLIGTSWHKPARQRTELTTQTSGATLLEAVAAYTREGSRGSN